MSTERLAETKRTMAAIRKEREQEMHRTKKRARALLGDDYDAREMPLTLTVAQVDALVDESRRVRGVATATSDGLAVNRQQWCDCDDAITEGPQLIYYEVLAVEQERGPWTVRHGFACPSCRRVAQAG